MYENPSVIKMGIKKVLSNIKIYVREEAVEGDGATEIGSYATYGSEQTNPKNMRHRPTNFLSVGLPEWEVEEVYQCITWEYRWRITLLCFKNSAFFAVTSSLTHDHIRAVGAYDGGLRPTLS